MSQRSHGIAPIAVDAMGGDHAPAAPVQGAIAAARAGQAVVLVGPEAAVREELQRHRAGGSLPIRVRHAAEVVGMAEHPGQAMRRKRDNSIRVAFELVGAGEASAVVSAGNSGAFMAGAMLVLGRLGTVERPAFAQVLPGVKGPTLLLDMGANAECKPIHLVQFALLGEVWSRRVVGAHRPRVAILANGEEPSKGTELTRRAAAALERAPLRFAGYCEGRDLLGGELDVVVTDGFTGNVALKAIEGTALAVGHLVRQALRSTVPSKIGGLLARKALQEATRHLDWREVGGAPLLGVGGVAVVCHGASDALAMENALARARDAARAACTGEMAEAAALAADLLEGSPVRRRRAGHA